MTTLHINNQANFALSHLISQGDGLLLIENGVYWTDHTHIPVYALKADVAARNVKLDDSIALIDYLGFVELCEQYDKVVTW